MTFDLTILGSGSALPTPNRFSSAQVLNVLERFFLIDCGEGTQIQLRRFRIRISKIDHILISHLHGDHYLGIFGLLSTMSMLNRKRPINIYAPHGLKLLIDEFINTMDKGVNFDIKFHPLHYNQPEIIFEDEKITVTSFSLRHRVPTCGFLIKEKPRLRNIKGELIKEYNIPIKELHSIKNGNDFTTTDGIVIPNATLTTDPLPPRSYAYVSDTSKKTSIIPIINNVNLLYHEATFGENNKNRAKDTGHSTAKQAAEIAKQANVEKLIIGHFSNRYKATSQLLSEAKEIFTNTETAKDGAHFSI